MSKKELKVCWLSAGVSSFVAGYLKKDSIDLYIYIDIENQHPDSIPFDGTTCPKLTTLTHEILTISKKLHEELLPIKFFEVELDDNPRSKELDNTDELVGQVSVCVLGRRKPSFEEAEKFCSPALEATDLPYVIAVREIDAETAATYLDMNHLNAYPVFE